MTLIQSHTVGNVVVIVKGMERNGAPYVHVFDQISLSEGERATCRIEESWFLGGVADDEELELLFSDKEEVGRRYWEEFNEMVNERGVAALHDKLTYLTDRIIAAMGSGNYIFDLTGAFPYPQFVSHHVFSEFLRSVGAEQMGPQRFYSIAKELYSLNDDSSLSK